MDLRPQINYDPTDPAQVDDHDPVLARLRREAPVSELKPGLFYVARYKDIMDVCRAPETFRQGRHIPRELDTRTEDQLNLGETDPPEHLRVRKVLASLFSPSKISAMEPVVRGICESLVDRFARRGTADIIAEAFLAEVEGTPQHAQTIAWFKTLPLWGGCFFPRQGRQDSARSAGAVRLCRSARDLRTLLFTGKPQVISDRFACLDYSVAKGGPLEGDHGPRFSD